MAEVMAKAAADSEVRVAAVVAAMAVGGVETRYSEQRR